MAAKLNMNEVAVYITELELGDSQVNVADVKEILRIINTATDGKFYGWIKKEWIR